MIAERLLLAGVFALFALSPAVIALVVRPGTYSAWECLAATSLAFPLVGYLAWRVHRRSRNGVAAGAPSARTPGAGMAEGVVQRDASDGLTALAPVAYAVVLLLVVAGFAALPELDALRISRDVARAPGMAIRLVNLHVVATFLAAVLLFRGRRWNVSALPVVVISVGTSLAIALLEGRRSAVAVPLGVLGLLWVTTQRSAIAVLLRGSVAALGVVAIVLFVTVQRFGGVLEFDVLWRLLLERLFNPGGVALEVLAQGDRSFDPLTLSMIGERLRYVAGLGEYVGRTNEFGVHYGYLAMSNAVVAINPGVVVEAWLAFGWGFALALAVLVEGALALIRAYRQVFFGADLLVALLVVHGFQMEVPYTVGLMVKLAVALLPLQALRIVLRLARDRDGVPALGVAR